MLWLLTAATGFAALQVTELSCDWGTNPLGVDSETPRLAWKLAADHRGARQTGWQVRVASTRAGLESGQADVWDSARQSGHEQLQIPYAGRPLRTGEQFFWQVRVWGERNEAGPWSEIATWTMGVVQPADWSARWITDPSLESATRHRLGFSTPPVANENTPQWLALDLGAEVPLEKIGLHGVTHTVNERLGFPQSYIVEVASAPDFANATTLADTTREPNNPWLSRVTVPGKDVVARYVRIRVPRLRTMEEDEGGSSKGRFALSQIEVISGGKNLALGAQVTASASVEDERWSLHSVIDGAGLPGANLRATETLRLRREFPLGRNVKRAILFVSGLGQYVLSVNGRAVSEENRLTPGWTEYAKTVLYDTYDLTDVLRTGPNAIGLTLASGMYNVPYAAGRYTKFVGPPRALKAIAQLRVDYEDGRTETIATDDTWRAAPGPVTFSHVYGGEDYDATKETPGWDRPGFDARFWTKAAITPGPGGALRGFSSAAPTLGFHDTLVPNTPRELRPGVTVYDLGQNAALIPRLRVRGPTGATVKIVPSELVNPDGTLNTRSTHGGNTEAVWNYRLRGDADGETWTPQFFYHGARYLQLELTAPEGTPLPTVESLEGRVFHSTAAPVGEFATSNELLNRIRTLIRWAQRSNMVSVLTDCPHRERLGWLEQYHLNGPALRSEFDLTRLYAKTFQDMADAQIASGLVPDIAPEYIRFDGYFRDSPEWGSALILAAAQQLTWSGDDSVLCRHYDAMKRYLDYLTARATDGIVSHGLGDWYDLGPAKPGVSQLTPIPLVATAIYLEDTQAMALMAKRLGKTDDAESFHAQAERITQSFNARFLDSGKASYATGSQTALAMPLVVGLVPDDQRDAIVASLVDAVRRTDNVATAGDIGYRYLLNALAQNGRSDVIFDIANQTEKPGYGYQLAHGATSLTEAWNANPNSSQNHFMLGHIIEWFYGRLAGIAPDPSAPGFGRVVIRPEPVGDLTWVEASQETVRGKIAVRWDKKDSRFVLKVTIPANTTASVQLPAAASATITESGRAVAGRDDIRASDAIDGRPTFEIGSGSYVLEVR